MKKELIMIHTLFWLANLANIAIIVFTLFQLSDLWIGYRGLIVVGSTVLFVLIARLLDKRRVSIDPKRAEYVATLNRLTHGGTNTK